MRGSLASPLQQQSQQSGHVSADETNASVHLTLTPEPLRWSEFLASSKFGRYTKVTEQAQEGSANSVSEPSEQSQQTNGEPLHIQAASTTLGAEDSEIGQAEQKITDNLPERLRRLIPVRPPLRPFFLYVG